MRPKDCRPAFLTKATTILRRFIGRAAATMSCASSISSASHLAPIAHKCSTASSFSDLDRKFLSMQAPFNSRLQCGDFLALALR